VPGPCGVGAVTVEPACAKVNLLLAVGPPRPDGYHELVTLFETVSLRDEVTVEVSPSPDGSRSVRLALSPRGSAPAGPDNLAVRAAESFFAATDRLGVGAPGVAVGILLRKRVPVAAGLGGGSSDAAAVLRALERLLGNPLGPARLAEVAAGLGSDVPFFLKGGRAAGRSRGETLEPFPAHPRLSLVLGLPSFGLRTPDVYREFDRLVDEGRATWEPAEARERRLSRLLDALASGDPDAVAAALSNDLEPAAVSLRPEVRLALEALRSAGCLAAVVSGSGPAVFGLARRLTEGRLMAARAQELLACRTGGVRTPYRFKAVLSGSPGPPAPPSGRRGVLAGEEIL